MKQFLNILALVTGGSSGIGLALAKNLASQGAHVWILARRIELLQSALQQLQGMRLIDGQKFGIIACDITNREHLLKEITQFQSEIGTPDLLINAAGYSYPATFTEIPIEVFYHQMDVNYFGSLNTIHTLLPGMLQRGSGTIVNVSSMVAFLSIYGFTAYGASKCAVRGFTDALRSELKPLGIQVCISFPPDTDTPGLVEENKVKSPITKEVSSASGLVSPETVAASILKGVQQNRYIILTGFESNLFYRSANLLGKLQYPVIDMLVAQATKKISRQAVAAGKRKD